jgi:hypothetical protein
MGNYYILVALKEKKYVRFEGYSKENEIMLNMRPLQLAVGFLRMYDQGYGGGAGVFAFIGDEWTPSLVIDPDTKKRVNWDYVFENYEDVTKEVIQDLEESGIISIGG